MEPPVVKKRGRPRKRRAQDENDGDYRKSGPEAKKQTVETRSIALVGRYVLKDFGKSGIFLGKVVYYEGGLYRINYEDGDYEDLESGEIRSILVGDVDLDTGLSVRRKKLDDLVLKLSAKTAVGLDKNVLEMDHAADRVESPALSPLYGGVTIENDDTQVEGDDDSSTDSFEDARDRVRDMCFDAEPPPVPPPQLPPSSGTIGVPEPYVSHLLSVYGFFRSFSISLFLNPFTLDDFVGSLNCRAPNTLLDAIHVALLRALRLHLEALSSDGSEVAPKCLRCADWNLLDALTWPVYLVQYLTIMGYTKGPEWKGFYDEVLEKEYYLLSVGRKLVILQILCDDALDTRDIRAELDMREESETGIDHDAEVTNPLVSGPRRVHPRNSKTSACKDREAVETISEVHQIKSSGNSNLNASRSLKAGEDAADADVDCNADECRLCGMEGNLLCCDGCPSAYHTRCIGLMKLSIPQGSWYCPECTINKAGPPITAGTSLQGAHVFGTDSYEQIFMGTCNHLLVLKATINTEPCLRYYNQDDIPKVLKVLYSCGQHTAFYLSLCKEILQYWNIQESIFTFPDVTEAEIKLENIKEGESFYAQSLPLSRKENYEVVEAENHVTGVSESNLDNVAASSLGSSFDMIQVDPLNFQGIDDSIPLEPLPMNTKMQPRKKVEYAVSTGSATQQADSSDLIHRSSVDRSNAIHMSTFTSGNTNSCYYGHANGMRVSMSLSTQSEEGDCVDAAKGYSSSVVTCGYMGALYKPLAYINYYMHGEFAASAAAKLAVISSEEARVSDSHALGNQRKVTSANNLLQTKAFSLAASRFFWPSSEKKLVEVPRERCGWCLSCQATGASKRGCMLNHAALCATKGATKVLASLRPIKSGEGNLVSIATYMLYMEETLRGLVTGPFANENYRKQWCNRVYQASNFSAIKVLLLELEANIRTIALSGEWIKLVDDWLAESSVIQSAMITVGSTQKRGSSSRRGRKQNTVHEDNDDASDDRSFVWWQGGKLSKHIFHRAILAFSLVKRAARQGGRRKIPGISYADGSEIPKRSRQSVWRAAVEISKNAPQLALQVRYLDYHLRWSDLVRPEHNLVDGKGAETEASVFRNANVCDKKFVKNSNIYRVDFGNQKHLPSRVMKSIIDMEQNQDGENKFWFSELRIPLYLVKDYEERIGRLVSPSAEEPLKMFHKLPIRRWKVPHRNIFFYLVCKRDNLDLCSCSTCQLDVLMRDAVKCSSCQGYCHEDCTISSTVSTSEEVEFLITCKQCHHAKALIQDEDFKESPTSPLHLQMQEYHTPATATGGGRPKVYNKPVKNVKAQESRSEMKLATSESSLFAKKRRPICSWGIIWKKKNGPETATDFRLTNILLGGGSGGHGWYPVCHLCHMPYQSDLTYICCESCKNWYHAEAVELEESKISDVAGFKCCKCRRIRSPVCPYTDPEDAKVQESKKGRTRRSKKEINGDDSDSATFSVDSKVCEPATPMFPMEEPSIQDGDPLLFSLARVELIAEDNLEVNPQWNNEPGPRKLPVRRGVKREEDVDGFEESNISYVGISTQGEMSYPSNPMEIEPSHFEWDASNSGVEYEMMDDYEDLNYDNMEPQTVFTINELLAPDDGGQEFVDVSENMENPYTEWQDGGPEQYNMATFTDQTEYTMSLKSDVYTMQCQICSQAEPLPDLSCQNCSLLIHSHCSPWIESSSGNGSWKCGQCREWR